MPMEMETMTLSVLGRSAAVLQELIDSAIAANVAACNDELAVFVMGSGWPGGWEKALSKKPRSIEVCVCDIRLLTCFPVCWIHALMDAWLVGSLSCLLTCFANSTTRSTLC